MEELDYYESEEETDYEYFESDPCTRCGPWCNDWMGDNLCRIVIDQQAKEDDEYHANYVKENYCCPTCGKKLILYEIPTDELWQWPGDFYNPMIALDIYAIYGAPKGLIHSLGHIHHIYIGNGEYREEKLVKLIKQGRCKDALYSNR